MSEWKEYKLGDVATINDDSIKQNYPFDEIEYLDTGSITKGKIESLQQLKLKEAPSRAKRLVTEYDIVYSTVRPIQRHFGFIEKNNPKLVVSTGFAVIRSIKDKVNSKFLYHLLSSDEVVNYLDTIAEGSTSTYPSLRPEDLAFLDIQLPPLPEQKAIAEILSSFDDKIDLLHRQNKTLEQLAETLFRQWFVEEADESWEVGKLGDLITVKYGKDQKKLNEGNIPVYGSGGVMRFADKALYNSESVLVPRKGTLSNIVYIDEPFWTVDTMFYTLMNKPNLAKFIYIFLKGQDLASMNVGSAVPSMTTEILNNMTLNIPPDFILEKFEIEASPLFEKIKLNSIQIKSLSKLRDTLLPKLMSGEVRVKN